MQLKINEHNLHYDDFGEGPAVVLIHGFPLSRMMWRPQIEPLVDAGALGKKSGSGLFLWRGERGGKQKNVGRNPKLSARGGFSPTAEEIVDRCVLAMVAEAARALEEGVVRSAGELDLGVVFGTGFAPFRGGPLRYADTRGIREIVTRLEVLDTASNVAPGERAGRFRAPQSLLDLAGTDGTFHA